MIFTAENTEKIENMPIAGMFCFSTHLPDARRYDAV